MKSPAYRYETLDALRGVAALSVVLWHWQLLYWRAGDSSPHVGLGILPFSSIFAPFYLHGLWGVHMFFSISGFIFFYLYADAIAQRRVTLATFANYRLSRLYPLHLATLLFVAAIQAAYFHYYGSYFVYQLNDVRHFALQLFFISNWDKETVFTFNGPIWSVSLEIFLYAVFFALAVARLTHPTVVAATALFGALIVRDHAFVGSGMLSFFSGGLCYYLVRGWRDEGRMDWTAALSMVAVISGSIAIQRIRPDLSFAERFVEIVAFPAIIVTLSLNEHRLSFVTSRLRWLGNISYSAYLIHFPLALLLVTATACLGLVIDPSSDWLLLAYLSTLIALSLFSFHYFETPVQQFLRETLSRSKVPVFETR
jgi:peptidoglycan/LPS O-acetylase OafA/YrhL